jgi:hypothetical protein
MKDPVYEKLKSDAGSVLHDLWQAITHQAAARDQPNAATKPGLSQSDSIVTEPNLVRPITLFYFHLN